MGLSANLTRIRGLTAAQNVIIIDIFDGFGLTLMSTAPIIDMELTWRNSLFRHSDALITRRSRVQVPLPLLGRQILAVIDKVIQSNLG